MSDIPLFLKFKLPFLKDIQTEVLDYFNKNPQLLRPDCEHEYFVHVELKDFPTLNNFITSRIKDTIGDTSVCFIPGNFAIKKHIDGHKESSNQFVLNIPIANYTNATNYWYKNEDVADSDQYIHNYSRIQYPFNLEISYVKEGIELTPIGSTTVDNFTIMRSDIYHDVHNHGNESRMVFLIRFTEFNIKHDSMLRVFDYSDLEIAI